MSHELHPWLGVHIDRMLPVPRQSLGGVRLLLQTCAGWLWSRGCSSVHYSSSAFMNWNLNFKSTYSYQDGGEGVSDQKYQNGCFFMKYGVIACLDWRKFFVFTL